MHRQYRLLLDALHRHEAHVRPTHRLTDRFGIGDIIFIRLHVRLNKLRCNKPYRMSKALQRTGPVMRTGAGLDPNHTRRQISKKYGYLRSSQLLAQYRLTPFIDPMHLEHVLRQINPDRCNLHGGRSYPFKWLHEHFHFGTLMPFSGGGVHPIAFRLSIPGPDRPNLAVNGRQTETLPGTASWYLRRAAADESATQILPGGMTATSATTTRGATPARVQCAKLIVVQACGSGSPRQFRPSMVS